MKPEPAAAGPELAKLLENARFPRSASYDPDWVADNQMGPSALWLTEWLCERLHEQYIFHGQERGNPEGTGSLPEVVRNAAHSP